MSVKCLAQKQERWLIQKEAKILIIGDSLKTLISNKDFSVNFYLHPSGKIKYYVQTFDSFTSLTIFFWLTEQNLSQSFLLCIP